MRARGLKFNLRFALLTILVLLIIILIITFYLKNNMSDAVPAIIDKTSPSPPSLRFKNPPNPENVRCAADVRQCPDGSYVGRVAPLCSFVPCPEDIKY
ncbi:hypothetical protein ACFL0Y_03540 [Patescibacteria group bacterium]